MSMFDIKIPPMEGPSESEREAARLLWNDCLWMPEIQEPSLRWRAAYAKVRGEVGVIEACVHRAGFINPTLNVEWPVYRTGIPFGPEVGVQSIARLV